MTDEFTLPRLLGDDGAQRLTAAMSVGAACVVHGPPDRFAGLFDEARLRGALAAMAADPGARFGAIIRDPLGDGLTFTEAMSLADLDETLAAGHTICATDLAPYDADLAAALRTLGRSLACAADLRFNAYLSPTGARTAMHTDTRISTSLQLTGRKRWRYQPRAAVVYPASNAQIDRFGDVHWMNPLAAGDETMPPPDRAALAEVVLGPGDLLSVPAGAWHEVVTEERGLALNLSLRPTAATTILHALIDAAFAADGEWRRGLPIVGAEAQDGEVPPAVQERLRARLADLRAWTERFDVGGPAAAALWRALIGE